MDKMTKSNLWKMLDDHAELIRFNRPKNQTQENTQKPFSVSANNIHLDYSKQHLTHDTLTLLFKLAEACNLREKIKALINGEHVNQSENKPALHTALRATNDAVIMVNHKNVMPDITAARHDMRLIAEKIRNKAWLGFSGIPLSDVVNIGIGGSDLGPRFAITALKDFATDDLTYHFISDADPHSFANAVAKLNPDTTLFIVSSKSFTTQETIYNAKKALDWIGKKPGFEKHFIAVTANAQKATELGITTILPLWDWIGGRYSFVRPLI
jgi:glucose-6-phosphate isomerase